MSTIEATAGSLTDTDISGVDAAVKAAKARVDARKAAKAGENNTGMAAATDNGDHQARKKYTPQERIERAQQLEKEREDRAAARKAESDKKKAAATANRGTPHMSKVEKAAAGLAPMDAETQAYFDQIKGELGQAQIDTLLAHLAFLSRRSATEGSLDVKLEAGQQVRIVSGPAKLIGKVGIVEKAQRIHCYVSLEGASKPAYLFNYNVSPLPAENMTPAEPEQEEVIHDEGPEPEDAPALGEQPSDESPEPAEDAAA